MFSDCPEEAEVAFPTGTQFNVTSRQIKDENGSMVDFTGDVHESGGGFGNFGLAGNSVNEFQEGKVFLKMTEFEEVNIQMQNNNSDKEYSMSGSTGDLPLENEIPDLP